MVSQQNYWDIFDKRESVELFFVLFILADTLSFHENISEDEF